MHGFSGRSWPCSCNSHSTELLFTDDHGIHLVKLGEETPDDVAVFAGRSDDAVIDDLVRRFRAATSRLEEGRADLPSGEPGLFAFNAWNVNQPGSTLFVPVTDTTVEYMTLLFIYFDEINRFSVIDELSGGRTCGLDHWVQRGRLGAVELSLMDLELRVLTSLNVEGAFICQNMSLAAQALGLGGWAFTGFLPHHILGVDPAHRGLGFRFVTPEHTPRHAVKPVPVGRDGVMQALCPPYVARYERRCRPVPRAVVGSIRKAVGVRPGVGRHARPTAGRRPRRWRSSKRSARTFTAPTGGSRRSSIRCSCGWCSKPTTSMSTSTTASIGANR